MYDLGENLEEVFGKEELTVWVRESQLEKLFMSFKRSWQKKIVLKRRYFSSGVEREIILD